MTEAKRDNAGKPDLSLIPYAFEKEIAQVMMHGQVRYGRMNYVKGHRITSLIASMKRHIGKLLAGKDIDEESGCSHWAHIAAGCLMALHQQELGTLRDDRFKGPISPSEPGVDYEIRAKMSYGNRSLVLETHHDLAIAERRLPVLQSEWEGFTLEIVAVPYGYSETT